MGIALEPLLVSLIAAVTAIIAFNRIARRVGLVDRPSQRKWHEGEVPLVGGLGILVGICFGMLSVPFAVGALRSYFAVAMILVMTGLLDDFREITARSRLLIQVIAAVLLVYWSGESIENLGNLLGTGDIALGALSIPFTVFAIVGLVNAINMIDGLDGLAGMLSLIACLTFAFCAITPPHKVYVYLALVTASAVAGFLVFNLPWRLPIRVFLGDAGSMLLGVTIALLSIALSQGTHAVVVPVGVLWILLVPLYDTGYVMIRRLLQGRSPFSADQEHLHHLLRRLGFSNVMTLTLISAGAVASTIVGLNAGRSWLTEAVLFVAYLAGFIAYCATLSLAWRRVHSRTPQE